MTTSANNHLIQTYLFFNGRCEEAVEFYKKNLGAEVQMLMRCKESPEPPPPGCLPAGFDNKIMHCSFRIGSSIVMASDGNSDKPVDFDGFSLSLTVPTEDEANRTFDALTNGGQVIMPIGKTFWSPRFGMVKDKFGVHWMVTVPPHP
jgi:PhnB protein